MPAPTSDIATTRWITPPVGARKAALVGVLALLSIFPPIATDMYLSGLHDVATYYRTDAAGAEMSLSIFFFGLGLGQLITGPLIDALGRKLPVLGGVALFAASSLALLLVDDISAFNALRLLQALGGCVGMVVGRTLVMDLYEGREAARTLTVLVMLMTVGPIVSPFLGSLMVEQWGWRSIFGLMVAIGALSLVLSALIVPETLPRAARGHGALRRAFTQYGELLRRPTYRWAVVCVALVQAAMFAFITASAGVFKTDFGLGNLAYGLAFGVIAIALVLASQANAVLLRRYSPEQLTRAALGPFIAAALWLTLISGTQSLWALMVPLWLAMAGVGLLSANTMAMAMAAAGTRTGVGSSLLGAVQFAVAFLASSLVAHAPGSNALGLALGFLVPAVLATLVWFALYRKAASRPL
ncbi:multidrug effflux MFS transporter [Novosphingobium sp. 1949]|uniref:Bcr/CflA family efflux transporter n=1 Tax=Novosphingobium organovorum TaxID=2930092 RepID=A0ABT0BGV2_9SPHN|nr:multidrug effflux MFS transporter [Novosphingobium organovorum]MCJ2184264.1 multidrug effflux MFS transporter [Novosphingobium organovorum]